jgi:hypothetical protein
MMRAATRVVILATALGLVAAPVHVHPAVSSRSAMASVLVSRDGYPSHSSPTIVADPLDPSTLLAVSALVPRRPPTVVGAFWSSDDGLTWRAAGPLPVPAGDSFASDTNATYDGRGIGFVSAATARFSQRGSSNTRSVYVCCAPPGQRTFAAPVLVARDVLLDHPWIAATSDPSHPVLYVVSDAAAGILFSRSTNERRTLHAIWDDTRTGSLQLFTTSIPPSQTSASVPNGHLTR